MTALSAGILSRSSIMGAALLLIPFALSFYAGHLVEKNLMEVNQAKFEALAHESEKSLISRMESYKQALLGARGVAEGVSRLTGNKWQAYVNAMNISENLPGINGIGVIEPVAARDLTAYVQSVRAGGAADFQVHPFAEHASYFVIRFIAPEGSNKASLGLNIAFESNRYAAAVEARDSGRPTITKRVSLVQDQERSPGFLLLLPSYQRGMPTSTQEQRRAAFLRWIYAPFIAKNFMTDLTPSQGHSLQLQVFDGTEPENSALIFDSNSSAQGDEASYRIAKQVELMQRKWLLVWTSTESFERAEKSYEPFLVLLAGLLFSGLFAVFLLITTSDVGDGRRKALRSYFMPLAAFVVTLCAASFLQKEFAGREKTLVARATDEAAAAMREIIVSNMSSRIAALRRMSQRWVDQDRTSLERWSADAAQLITDQPGLHSIQWLDSSLQLGAAVPPTTELNPLDLSSAAEVQIDALLQAPRSSKSLIITPPVKLASGDLGFISYFPLPTQLGLDGFIAGIFSTNELLQNFLPRVYEEDFHISLKMEGQHVFGASTDLQAGAVHKVINLFGNIWTLSVAPTDHFIARHNSFLPELILIIGVILAIGIALIIDFAQRSKQKSVLLADKENLLTTFVKHTPVAVAMFDQHMCYVAASDRWLTDYNLRNTDIIGHIHESVYPDDNNIHPRMLQLHQRAMEGEIIKEDEEPVNRRDGLQDWLRYEVHPWYNRQGQVEGMIMFRENITERKRMDIMKDEFISTINHELRTPLTSIKGSLGLLRLLSVDRLDDKSLRLLDISYNNCERLALLVNDILDSEKIAAGKMHFHLQKTELVSLVHEIVEQNQGYADKYGVTFEVVDKVERVYCSLDRNRFNQALANLLSNAAKFSHDGDTATVTIELTRDQGEALVAVSDKGMGVPVSFQKNLFSKFAQADSSSTRAKGGTGLGLNITKSIIEALGGKVGYTTVEGGGSTFFFQLPVLPHDKV